MPEHTSEKRVRWGDHGTWCNRCVNAQAVWSGLCESCHKLAQPERAEPIVAVCAKMSEFGFTPDPKKTVKENLAAFGDWWAVRQAGGN